MIVGMFTHILTVLGGIVIIAGAALSIWPFLPIEIAYALIAIGVVTVCAGIFSLARNRQKPQTQILPSVQLILRDAHGLTVATG